MYNYKQSNSRFQYILRKMCKKLSIFAFYIKTPRFIFCTLVMCDKCKIWCQIRMKHPAKKSKKRLLFTRIKNKKEKIVLPQANRLFAPPAASAAERSKTIFCRFHAVILTTGAKKKNSISRLFPVCRPLTTGTGKKSLFSRLPPPGVLYHRREKINLDFSASPSGHPSRRRRKAELIFPASPVCRPSFRCRKAKLVFPVFPSVILTKDTEKKSLFSRFSPLLAFASAARYLFPCSSPALPFSQTRTVNHFLSQTHCVPAFPGFPPHQKRSAANLFPSLFLPSSSAPLCFFHNLQTVLCPALSPLRLVSFPTFHKPWILTKKTAPHRTRFFLLLFKFVQFN